MFIWRAVDDEGEVLEVMVQKRRNVKAELKLLRCLFGNTRVAPAVIVTVKLASYRAAVNAFGLRQRH